MIDYITQLLVDTFRYVVTSISHNALVLLLGIAVAAAVRVYAGPERMRAAFAGKAAASIPASVLFGTFTPFCACGTMAVVLSMCASLLPWGPVMAFLVSSPLMSPDGFVLMGGILGFRFAMALVVASVVMGLVSGFIADRIARRTSWLDGQLRGGKEETDSGSIAEQKPACGCGEAVARTAAQPACGCGELACAAVSVAGCGCGQEEAMNAIPSCQSADRAMPDLAMPAVSIRRTVRRLRLDELLRVTVDLGLKQILPMFMLFAGIGYLVNRLVPAEWIQVLFGADRWYSIPLAALIGLPMYVSGDGSIPLIRSLMDSGAGPGALMAFLITGPGTSAGVIAGLATILRRRAVILYVGLVLAGGMVSGFLYSLL